MLTFAWLFALALALLAAWFALPFALRKRGEARLDRQCRAGRSIVLSYDDGPGPGVTPRLLDLLAEYGVTASFHLLGRNARATPALVSRLVAEGHDVGSHTQDHANAWKAPPWCFARDLAAGITTVEAMGGKGRRFRPPYGKMTLAGLIQGAVLGLDYHWWTIDSRDSYDRRPAEEVLDELRRRGGGVVLMHDFDSYDRAPKDPPHPDYVLDLTRRLLDLARDEGYRILPLSDLERGA